MLLTLDVKGKQLIFLDLTKNREEYVDKNNKVALTLVILVIAAISLYAFVFIRQM